MMNAAVQDAVNRELTELKRLQYARAELVRHKLRVIPFRLFVLNRRILNAMRRIELASRMVWDPPSVCGPRDANEDWGS